MLPKTEQKGNVWGISAMVDNYRLMPSILDREISTPDKDAFGHRHYSNALRGLIEGHSPPYSIGLLGGWGTGKSTIKELYIKELGDDQTKQKGSLTRSDRVQTITFNAWRFGGEGIKRALLRHVFLELGGDEEALNDRLFRQIQSREQRTKPIRELILETFKVWGLPLLPIAVLLVLILFVLAIFAYLLELEDEWAITTIAGLLITAFTFLFRQIKFGPVSPFTPITRVELPSASAEQYEDLLLDQLKGYKAGKGSRPRGKYCERLVVFVDDLDRLSAEEMVQGLDAIRTFMEIPTKRLPEGLGIVFVISCDEDKVADALARGRRQPDLPGTVFNRFDARRYLDRIFQFRLDISPFPRADMRQYALERLKDLPGINDDLKAKISLETLVDRMIHVDVQTPRNALQIVNAFAQAWWLAKKRETEELGTGRPGGLYEGSVTNHPLSLGALCALKVNYPDFYNDLLEEPELIQRFTDVVIRKKPLDEQPSGTQNLLRERYLQKSDTPESSITEVKQEYRSLRQYLSSLIGLRWPDSLQSLLLLSEDPITRKFGAKARRIYEAFVSGDTQGVLEGLGRNIDSNVLPLEEARLLYLMGEELHRESPARRVNASRVVADLVERLPKEHAHLLVGPLCRELIDSLDLRSQLGIQKIQQVCSIAEPVDRGAIASRLVEDVLTIDRDMSFRLETMEPPSLDEGVSFAREAVALALSVRDEQFLDPSADAQLLTWLTSRIVRAGGKEYQLPFSELEHWMTQHEVHLLRDLGEQYIGLLASQLEGQEAPDFDIALAIGRARKAFVMLWNSGELTRPRLWENLGRYVALQQPEATQAAWENMEMHASSPARAEISRFVEAFAHRLQKEAQDEAWQLDLDAAATALLSIVRARVDDLDDTALRMLSELDILWSAEEKTANLSCELLNEIRRTETNETQQVFDNWIGRVLGDLPIDCVKLLGSLFPSLGSSSQLTIAKQLRLIVNNDNINEPTGDRYREFVESVPEESWETDVLRSHLDQLLPQIAARHNNPNSYLYRVFPGIAPLLRYGSPGPLGQMLHQLFASAKGQLQHYAWLHSHMIGQWPTSSADLNPYNPRQIFRDANEFAASNPTASSRGLLNSMRDMLGREIVPADQAPMLVKAACSTWNANPDNAIDTFRAGFTELTPAQTADLLRGVNWAEEKHSGLLMEAWGLIIKKQEHTARIDTTNRILKAGPSGPNDEPDRGLRIWIDAQGENRLDLLASAIIQTDLQDAHRKRIWHQASRLSKNLGPDLFVDIVPAVLVLTPIDETASAIFADADHITEILSSTDRKSSLSRRLMEAFTNASTKTIKAGIAKWCHRLSGQASLTQLEPDSLTDDDISILGSEFPGAPALKRLQKERKIGTA